MKITVITENGEIKAFAHGSKVDHTTSYSARNDAGSHAGLRALPGQDIHEVEVPDDLERIVDGQVLHDHLRKLIKK